MQIVLIVGASGTGKDSLLRSARSYYQNDPRFCFARRYITRPADANEDNFYIDRAGFQILKNHGYFITDWSANGNLYGIPWSATENCPEATLFCSVSRTAIRSFEKQFPQVSAIQITARPEMLLDRLTKRGREDSDAIKKRIARAQEPCRAKNLILFDNTAPLSKTTISFIDLLPELVNEHGAFNFDQNPVEPVKQIPKQVLTTY